MNICLMSKLSVQVYALKDNLCKIQQKNVRLVAQQATLSQHLDIVFQDVLVIHKHLLILPIKYVYMNVFLWVYMLIIQQMNVWLLTAALCPRIIIQIDYLDTVYYFALKVSGRKIQLEHALIIVILVSLIIILENVFQHVLLMNKLMEIQTRIDVSRFVLINGSLIILPNNVWNHWIALTTHGLIICPSIA